MWSGVAQQGGITIIGAGDQRVRVLRYLTWQKAHNKSTVRFPSLSAPR